MRQLLNWFRRGDLERGLDRELRYHIDRRVGDLIFSGLPEPEARRQAMQELGGLTQVREEVRDVWLTRWLRDNHDIVVASIKLPDRPPDFSKRSRAVPIGPFQAALELAQEMLNRHQGSLLATEFEGRETHLVAEIAGLLDEARCIALWPGRPEEALELLCSVVEAPDVSN